MLTTEYGVFDGDSWESACQLIFKSKYCDELYQEMVASPGDFGIEGFTGLTGKAFQCYCPDGHYTKSELYEKQRDKITEDLGKLKKYESQIASRIGDVKIKQWEFVTPLVGHNDLLKHAKKKQLEVVSWGLGFIDSDFSVLIKDAQFYAQELCNIKKIKGEKMTFFSVDDVERGVFSESSNEYEENIRRKNLVRCTFSGILDKDKHRKLNALTAKKWLKSDELLSKIESDAPEVYFQIMRAVSQFESEVEEMCLTWQGEPEALVVKIRDELANRIAESVSVLDDTERYRLSDQMTSKWLALCPLEIFL